MGDPSCNISLRVQRLGVCAYRHSLEQMREHIATRQADDLDELWLLQHQPVITTGVRGRHFPPTDLSLPDGVELVVSDRGGLTTAHNPGQAVAYCLWQLERLRLTVPQMVRHLENCVIGSLATWGIKAKEVVGQPGVYVDGRKIASIGLRIRAGWSYHGLSVNVCNDLDLFDDFAPCGIEGLDVVSLHQLGVEIGLDEYFAVLVRCLVDEFGFTEIA